MPDAIQNTAITDSLNDWMKPGTSGVFTGGLGVLVRDVIDTLQDGPNLGVPATMWTNDMISVSQMYPDRTDLDGVSNDIYSYASVGFVVGSAMVDFFPDFDNMQDATWGWGVFYAHDANSIDIRCRWLESYNLYDCPHGYIPVGSSWTDWDSNLGTGGYPVGNPYANSSCGGGAGCHLDGTDLVLDQIHATNNQGEDLVQDNDCQCNYAFNQNWADWVDLFATAPFVTHNLQGDAGICWVNNPRDMINMQNWLYLKYRQGVWQQTNWIFSGSEERQYMGWNEVPVDGALFRDPTRWDAFLIKLPANVCGNGGQDDLISCLTVGQQTRLTDRIQQYQDAGLLIHGRGNVWAKPGSYTVVVREWVSNDAWSKQFFCHTWDAPNLPYHVVHGPDDDGNIVCYYHHGSATASYYEPLMTGALNSADRIGESPDTRMQRLG